MCILHKFIRSMVYYHCDSLKIGVNPEILKNRERRNFESIIVMCINVYILEWK